MDSVKKAITQATYFTAISIQKLIKEKGFSSTDILDDKESLDRERMIDQAGVDAMATAITDIPFVLNIVGSEGRKHIHQYGEALPTLDGVFGSGDLKLDMVNDVVEGSKAAKLNIPGAMSVIAVSSHKGLMGTPSDIDYMDKLFGPPQLKRKISFSKTTEENLAEVVEVFGVKPSEINVVIMDRERNAHYINACQKFGVNLILIKTGDFLPSILSFMEPGEKGIHLIMGSGGFEEGILAAVAGKALGGMVEGRGWSGDVETQKKYIKIWSVDDLIPGKIKDCLVSVSAITDENQWFDLDGVQNGKVTTLTVDSSGVNINSTTHH